jgi:hypothetical protein
MILSIILLLNFFDQISFEIKKKLSNFQSVKLYNLNEKFIKLRRKYLQLSKVNNLKVRISLSLSVLFVLSFH